MIHDALANSWHMMPAVVTDVDTFDSKLECKAQITIKAWVRQQDGSFQWTTITPLIHLPVVYPRGGEFLITLPLAVGDEVLICFADRCVDAWWQNGGIQIQAELRIHDISDGFAIPGPWSVPGVPANVSTDTLQIRTKDGTAYIELTADGKVNIVAPGGVHVTGEIVATDEITAKSSHTVSGHVHPDVQSGSDDTGLPTG